MLESKFWPKKSRSSTYSSPLPLPLQCLLRDQGVATVLFALKVNQITSKPRLLKRLTNVIDIVGSAISILPFFPTRRQCHWRPGWCLEQKIKISKKISQHTSKKRKSLWPAVHTEKAWSFWHSQKAFYRKFKNHMRVFVNPAFWKYVTKRCLHFQMTVHMCTIFIIR